MKYLLLTKASLAPNGDLPGCAAGRKSQAAPPSVPAGGAAHADAGAGNRSAAEGGAVADADRADVPAPAEAAPASANAARGARQAKSKAKRRSKQDYAAWAAATPESCVAASQQYLGAGGSGKPAAEGPGEAQAPGQGSDAQPPAAGQADAASTANGAPFSRVNVCSRPYGIGRWVSSPTCWHGEVSVRQGVGVAPE